jgi:hypothetical protein
MRSTALAILLAVSAASSLPGVAAASPSQPAPAQLEIVQFLAWNNSGAPIDLEVRLNDEVVFRKTVPSSDIPSAIDAGEAVQRGAGAYSLEVVDHTRNLHESARIDIAHGGPNFGVYLIPDKLALILTHQRLPAFAPGISQRNAK